MARLLIRRMACSPSWLCSRPPATLHARGLDELYVVFIEAELPSVALAIKMPRTI